MIINQLSPARCGQIALEAPARTPCSYRELREQQAETYKFLRQHGFGRGACIATVAPPGCDAATLFLSVASACRCAPLNPALRPEEFAFVFSDTKTQALVIAGDVPVTLIQVARDCGVHVFIANRRGDRAGDWSLSAAGYAAPQRNQDSAPGGNDIALYLHTSGTTARPKLVPILHSSILDTAYSISRSLELTADDCGLCIMPLFHVHGLISALLAPLTAGGRVWCAPGFQAGRFHDWLIESGASWYTAVPTMHQAILLRPRRQLRSHRLRFIRSCSAPLPEAVWTELRNTFGVPVVQAYGMTEAAHQISSTSLADNPCEMGSVGLSTGPEIGIMNAGGNLEPKGQTGEVVLRGESVIRAYTSPAEANSAFSTGWFHTGDQGYIDAHGNLRLTGRLKELINRAGEKISPYEVEDILLRHAGVEQAVAFAIPDQLLGETVGVAVVPKRDADVTELSLRVWCRQVLAPHKVPRQVVIVDQLPRGSTGKLQRLGMAGFFGLGTSGAQVSTS